MKYGWYTYSMNDNFNLYQEVYVYIWNREDEPRRNNTIEIMPRRRQQVVLYGRTSSIDDRMKVLPFDSFTKGLIYIIFQDFDSGVKDKILAEWDELKDFLNK